jgi:arylsulfatase A-like enzyme
MDLMPTVARVAGTTEPQDRTIDGKDISPLIFGEEGATTPHETFCYYRLDDLEAVRKGKWKLHFAKGRIDGKDARTMRELYDLESDIGEANNVFDEHPDIVRELEAVAEKARADLGDTLTETEGSGRRTVGLSESPKPLAEYNESHPYIVACYDTPDTKVMGG